MKKIIYFEDMIQIYITSMMEQLFPIHSKNKSFVYIIGFFHLLAALILQYGIWFIPQKYLIFYLLYSLTCIISYYFIFKKQCFLTLLTNYYANIKGNPLKIRMSTAIIGVGINILICIIGIIFPKYAPNTLLKKILN
jgi:hypothetical protein